MSDFVRIHQSYIVNFYFIKEISNQGVILLNGEALPISAKYSADFKKKYLKFRGVLLDNIFLEELFYLVTLPLLPIIIHYFYSHCFVSRLTTKANLVIVYSLYFLCIVFLHYSSLPGSILLTLNIGLIALLSFFTMEISNGGSLPLFFWLRLLRLVSYHYPYFTRQRDIF